MNEGSYNPTDEAAMGVLRLSKSSFGTYVKCPKQYWWTYIQELRPPANDAMIRGTAIHAILEDSLLKSEPILTSASRPAHAQFGKDMGVEALAEIMDEFNEYAHDWVFVEAEYKHEVPVTINGRSVILVGKIDGVFRRASGELVIVELKTGELNQGKVSRTKKELNFYRYMLSEAGYDISNCYYMVIAPDATNADVAMKLQGKRNTKVMWGETSGIAYIEKVHLGSYRNTVEKIESAIEGIYGEEWPMHWSEYFCPEWCAFHLSCEQEML